MSYIRQVNERLTKSHKVFTIVFGAFYLGIAVFSGVLHLWVALALTLTLLAYIWYANEVYARYMRQNSDLHETLDELTKVRLADLKKGKK